MKMSKIVALLVGLLIASVACAEYFVSNYRVSTNLGYAVVVPNAEGAKILEIATLNNDASICTTAVTVVNNSGTFTYGTFIAPATSTTLDLTSAEGEIISVDKDEQLRLTPSASVDDTNVFYRVTFEK